VFVGLSAYALISRRNFSFMVVSSWPHPGRLPGRLVSVGAALFGHPMPGLALACR